MNNYINTLIKLNKLHRKITHARYARNSVNNNNNNARQIMANRYRALIRLTHPLENHLAELAITLALSPNNIERIKRTRRVVSTQRIARKTIQKRRKNAVRRTMARRSLVVGAHHALTPAQIARFVAPQTRHTGTIRRPVHMTRAVTGLSRYLNR